MHSARESMANGVMARLWARMASAMPGTLRSHTACVASGVTSRSDRPLPPQVSTTSASMVSHASTMAALICGTSSFTTTWLLQTQPLSAMSCSSAAPAVSCFIPRVSEQVMMANVMGADA